MISARTDSTKLAHSVCLNSHFSSMGITPDFDDASAEGEHAVVTETGKVAKGGDPPRTDNRRVGQLEERPRLQFYLLMILPRADEASRHRFAKGAPAARSINEDFSICRNDEL